MSKFIYLTQGQRTVVDDDDYDLLMQMGPWQAAKRRQGGFFAVKTIYKPDKKTIFMHNVIFGKPFVTHINGNTLDNQRFNLEELGSHKNKLGSSRVWSSNKFRSKYKGVVPPIGKRKRWRARIRDNGKEITLGWFDTEEEAAKAYDKSARERFGVFASLNFPCPTDRYFGADHLALQDGVRNAEGPVNHEALETVQQSGGEGRKSLKKTKATVRCPGF